MTQESPIVLPFARLSGKNLQGDFDGGVLTSDGGVLFLRETELQIGVIGRFVEALDDRRDPRYTDHSYEELLRQRIFQIACGYEDANDCNSLRRDPAFKAACDRLPIVGESLASQPTMSRLDNAPRHSELYRMAQALLETFLASYDRVPKALIVDIDDTVDEVHGGQQQALFNGYYDAYCYLPLHIYEGQSGKLITSILRPGCRPSGPEIVTILKRVVGAIRRAWPEVLILLRGDGHFSTPEVHQWCESQEPVIFYILGQSGNAVLKREASGLLDQARSLYRYKQARAYRKKFQEHRKQQTSKSKKEIRKCQQLYQARSKEILKAKLYTTFLYQAESWSKPHRIICKAEVSDEGENVRFVVTNLETPRNQWIYETIYCGRGQMENYIKDHKLFLHSDRTSCHKFEANQFRVFLHSAAYVLMHTLRTKGLRGTAWGKAQFDQIQLRLLKVGARVEELKTKVNFHFPSAFPLKELYETVLGNLSRTELCRSP
jgi:hypothetical protein